MLNMSAGIYQYAVHWHVSSPTKSAPGPGPLGKDIVTYFKSTLPTQGNF
jgi:hypothetical protein